MAWMFVLFTGMMAHASAPNEVQAGLSGWDKFQFGMTPEQVRAVPGLTWGDPKELQNRTGVTGYRMESQPKVTRYNSQFNIVAVFDASQRLSNIHLTGVLGPAPSEKCEKDFQQLLQLIEAQFGPLKPQEALSEPFDTIQIPKRQISRDTRNVPGGTSQYEYDSQELSYQHGHSIAARATRDIGEGRIEAEMMDVDGTDKTLCGSHVDFYRGHGL